MKIPNISKTGKKYGSEKQSGQSFDRACSSVGSHGDRYLRLNELQQGGSLTQAVARVALVGSKLLRTDAGDLEKDKF